jgi:hypothetical protein
LRRAERLQVAERKARVARAQPCKGAQLGLLLRDRRVPRVAVAQVKLELAAEWAVSLAQRAWQAAQERVAPQ